MVKNAEPPLPPLANNIIIYRAPEKLTETTVDDSAGLHTNAFGDAVVVSHTFENGQGIIVFSEDVTIIGRSAFRSCTNMTSVYIPSSVTSIEAWALAYCSYLTNITCTPIQPPTLGSYPFYGNRSGRKIYVPSGSVQSYKNASDWSAYSGAIEAIPT